MKLIPIAQQTPKVGGSALEGAARNPSLSAEYYAGWSKTLVSASGDQSEGRFTVLPAVYARSRDDHTWQALRDASGLWTAI